MLWVYNPFRAEQVNGLGHNLPSINHGPKDGIERTEGRWGALGIGGAGEGGGRLVLEEQHRGGIRGGRGSVDLRGGMGVTSECRKMGDTQPRHKKKFKTFAKIFNATSPKPRSGNKLPFDHKLTN